MALVGTRKYDRSSKISVSRFPQKKNISFKVCVGRTDHRNRELYHYMFVVTNPIGFQVSSYIWLRRNSIV